MADGSDKAVENGSLNSAEAEKPQIEPIRLPTVEEIRGQDIWNNCAVRSVVSGVMGMPFNPHLFFLMRTSVLLLAPLVNLIDFPEMNMDLVSSTVQV